MVCWNNWVRFVMGRSWHRGIGSRRFWVGLVPKILGDFERVDLAIGPPGFFIGTLVQLPVMAAAERHGELITDFEAQGARLRKAQMMRVARLSSADQTRPGSDEFEMGLVTQPLGLGYGELALVDPTRSGIKPARDERRTH